MGEPFFSMERTRNLWAPWRQEYIESLGTDEKRCFLCRYRDEQDRDAENLVLWRGPRSMAMLNRFPYTGGHAMVAPLAHVGDLQDLDRETMLEMLEMTRDVQRAIGRALHAHGYNVGINIGRCAGAGLPDHLHVHVVPRWEADTNFMSVFGNVRVVSSSLRGIYAELRRVGEELHLPDLSG